MIPDHWSKTASIAGGAFSLSSTAIQVMELPLWLRVIVAAATVVSALAAIGFYAQFKNYSNAQSWVEKRSLVPVFSKSEEYAFRPASTEAAFAEACRSSSEVYGEENVSDERTRKWWRKFPEGVYAAYWEPKVKAHELAAYLSIWPLKAAAYNRLRIGQMRERDITHLSIEGINAESLKQYWYVSNIVVARRHRKTDVLRMLIQNAATHWRENNQLATKVSVLAFAYSREGENLLRRFGFHMLTESSLEGWPVFEFEANTDELLTVVGEKLIK